eukprot:6286363-Heterocapsa_arctica.AAC.1
MKHCPQPCSLRPHSHAHSVVLLPRMSRSFPAVGDEAEERGGGRKDGCRDALHEQMVGGEDDGQEGHPDVVAELSVRDFDGRQGRRGPAAEKRLCRPCVAHSCGLLHRSPLEEDDHRL